MLVTPAAVACTVSDAVHCVWMGGVRDAAPRTEDGVTV
jgi:hypothetical protein